jgi:capsular polysaccharide biosynthesis protein
MLSSSILEAQIRMLRGFFTPNGVGTEKIYVSRKNFLDRKNNEEPELEKIFEAQGYKCLQLEKYPVSSQIELITKAKEVAMFSGGSQALTYLCHPDTKVLWLRPSEYDLKAERDMERYFSEVALDIEVIEFDEKTDSIVSIVRERFNS